MASSSSVADSLHGPQMRGVPEMAWLRIGDRLPGERFWHSISTGYAVHTDPRLVLCPGICEVRERDHQGAVPAAASAAAVLGKNLNDACLRIIDWFADQFMSALLSTRPATWVCQPSTA